MANAHLISGANEFGLMNTTVQEAQDQLLHPLQQLQQVALLQA